MRPRRYQASVGEIVGPIPERVTRDLEALKLRLIDMKVDELPAEQAAALAQEISAIRLHLKRLAFDREALGH
jgi:phage FluMu protein gp41